MQVSCELMNQGLYPNVFYYVSCALQHPFDRQVIDPFPILGAFHTPMDCFKYAVQHHVGYFGRWFQGMIWATWENYTSEELWWGEFAARGWTVADDNVQWQYVICGGVLLS